LKVLVPIKNHEKKRDDDFFVEFFYSPSHMSLFYLYTYLLDLTYLMYVSFCKPKAEEKREEERSRWEKH